MHWVAPSEKDPTNDTLEKRLWDTADTATRVSASPECEATWRDFRRAKAHWSANSGLKAREYSGPILGIIFLARLYGVETRALNQAMKRNQDRFPADFMFDLAREEILRISQTVTSLRRLKFSKQVRAFTEHGALMAAMVLSSPRAVAMSVYVIRAFIQMREEQAANAVILKRRAEIDKTLLTHDAALRDIYHKLLPLLTPPPDPPRKEIGFHIKEDTVPYRVKKHVARS